MQTTDDWISQVTTWRFEQAWSSGTVATLRLPRTGTNTTLDPREGVIPGNEAEGPSFEGVDVALEKGSGKQPEGDTQGKITLSSAHRTLAVHFKSEDVASSNTAPPLSQASGGHAPSTLPSGEVKPKQTIPADWVHARQTRRIRDTKIDIGWFSSASGYPIDHPPVLAKDSKLEVDDIFIHTWGPGSTQAWRCTRTKPVVWVPIAEKETVTLPGDKRLRQFVITENGKPSYVVPGSVVRRYKDKTETTGNTQA